MASTANITATATYSSGPKDVTAECTWTTSDPEVATVETGTITAVAVGECTVTAALGGQSADVAVTVSDPLEGLAVSPTTAALDLGDE